MSSLNSDQKYQLAMKMAHILELMLAPTPTVATPPPSDSKPPPSPGIMDMETEEMLNKMIKEQLTVEQ